jgi:hypothetical protein
VWNKENDKVFEQELIKPIRAWAIQDNYFIYKPDEPDTDSDYIHLVDLERDNSTVKFLDFTHDPDCKRRFYNIV